MENQHLFVGCDVSKGHADFIFLDEKRIPLDKVYNFPDSPVGHEKLLKRLQILLETYREAEIHVGVESTGGYENHWCNLLRNYSDRLSVYRINPRAVKAFSRGQMTRNGTDAISAGSIANYMISHPEKLSEFKLSKERDELFYNGKKYLHFIALLTKQETQMRNAFEKLLFEHYPVLLALYKRKVPMHLYRLLSELPNIDEAISSSISDICDVKGVTEKRAIKIKKALSSQPVKGNPDFDLIQISAQSILQHHTLIAQQKKQLAKKYKQLPGVSLLTSIPGVGVDSAIAFILEIGDIHRFKSAKKLVAFFGMNPTMRESGDGRTRARLDKNGSSFVRSRLYMCVFSMISKKGAFKKRYKTLRGNGRKYKDACAILMHKLLRIVYGILKSGKPFDMEIDQNYQKKAEKARKKEEEKKADPKQIEAQKLQNESYFDAPISSHKARKLKEQTDVPIE